MAKGRKKAENQSTSTTKYNADVEQITEGVKKLSVKQKKIADEQPNGKTPYQGRHQCFGLYECEKCDNEWASSHSWANTWQVCLECGAKVYPHRQWPKKKRGKKDDDKPHQQSLCGKCIRIGNYCGNRSVK